MLQKPFMRGYIEGCVELKSGIIEESIYSLYKNVNIMPMSMPKNIELKCIISCSIKTDHTSRKKSLADMDGVTEVGEAANAGRFVGEAEIEGAAVSCVFFFGTEEFPWCVEGVGVG